jgi:hypothetical protein
VFSARFADSFGVDDLTSGLNAAVCRSGSMGIGDEHATGF